MQAKYSINNSTADYNITDQSAPFAEKQPAHNINYRKNQNTQKKSSHSKGPGSRLKLLAGFIVIAETCCHYLNTLPFHGRIAMRPNWSPHPLRGNADI
jgi:hypothetical protein